MLIGSVGGSARILFEDGTTLVVTVVTLPSISRLRGRRTFQFDSHFTVPLGRLSSRLQKQIRDGINKEQRSIHDRAPEYQKPRPGGLRVDTSQYRRGGRYFGKPVPKTHRPELIKLEKPPATVKVTEHYEMFVIEHGDVNGKPYLEVGRTMVLRAKQPHDLAEYKIGKIKGFTIL